MAEDTTAVITTATEPAMMSPLTRVIRTVLQALVALAGVVPTASAAFGISAVNTAKYTGYMAGAIILVSAIHNAINSRTAEKAKDRGAVDAKLILIVLGIILIIVLLFYFVDVTVRE